jgi:hypothetical protein
MLHSAFPNLPIIGKPMAGYTIDEDNGIRHVVMPEHVRKMNRKARSRWMDDKGFVPSVGGGAYSMFEMMQPFSSTDDVSVTAAAETALTNDEYLTLPANFFSFPGKCMWFRAMGKQSNVVTTPGTYTFRTRYSTPVAGGGVAGTVLQLSGAMTPNPVAVTDNLWYMDFWIKAVAVGKLTTSLSLLSWGNVWMANEINPSTVALWQARFMPPGGTALANVTGLDGTIAKAITATTTPTVATGSITVRDAWIVALN